LIPIDFVGADPERIAMACVCLGQTTTGEQCPARRLMELTGVDSLDETRRCCVKLIGFARKVLAHPNHMLYLRYTMAPATGAITGMNLTEGLIDQIGRDR
jgi:hypothetical protein